MEALKMRDAGKTFDAIISDIEMPDMDGIGFAHAVRAGGAWTALPLIALSAHADPHSANAGREAGFTGYVAKMERESLIANLRACLEEPVAA
jgi:two-component system chemotaxis sensor kinase CheA